MGSPDDLPKLVRDRIPDIIRDDGAEPVTERVDDDTAAAFAAEKLVEEAEEFRESRDIEELADLLEVVDAVLDRRDVDRSELEDIRREKRDERGGFDDGVVLRDIDG